MMRKIASFTINHDTLTPGMYLSRVDGDCITYDLRCKWPNQGDYLEQKILHTIEHLVATYVRSSEWSDHVVYFGPMGCRTGFYLILRDSVSYEQAITLVKEAFSFASLFEGEIPGAKKIECGNYLEHDLPGARVEAAAYVQVLSGCTIETLTYPGIDMDRRSYVSKAVDQFEEKEKHAYWMGGNYCSNCHATRSRPWAGYLEPNANTFCHVCGARMDAKEVHRE